MNWEVRCHSRLENEEKQEKGRNDSNGKPYIVCYVMASVDGRIDCDMVGRLAGVEDYYPLLDELGLQSAISGKTTARLELAESGEFKPGNNLPFGKEIVSKKTDSSRFDFCP